MIDVVWLIPALPLAGFLLLVVFGRKLGDPLAGWFATTMVGGSFALAVATFAWLLSKDAEFRASDEVTKRLFTWLPVGGLHVDVAFHADTLAMTMVLFVTGISTLIHLYSVGYMHGDPNYSKFFVYLNLFVFSMLVLVLADNFLLLFLGWEGVGACSYFLISFWFERERAAVAGKKAFITNRVGDWGFMVAMFLMFSAFGSLNFFGGNGVLTQVAHGAGSQTTVTAIALLLFLGAVGKSAQLPLYVWLPDAMEGPTPVSALIHAATMVTAGVYLMCRASPILAQADPAALNVIAVVGVATAFFAATIACAQNDIKKVLAYSTISQLGYMFLAVGSGAYVAAVFHMVTHAFFKALLFLGAGSVIHGLHDEQDMKRMGALRKWMPITCGTFIVGWLAIAGVPPFAGFWSKDDILLNAYDKSVWLWLVGLVTAGLTAYYMSRQVFLVFFGEPRWTDARDHAAATEAEGDAAGELTEPEPVARGDHSVHAGQPHESPWTMTVPLVVLAVLSTVGGLLNLPWESLKVDLLHRWLEPVFAASGLREVAVGDASRWVLAIGTAVLAVAAIYVAYLIFLRHRVPEEKVEPVVLQRAWGVDAAYAAFFGGPGRESAEALTWNDEHVVDGAVNGVAVATRDAAGRLRRVQTGYVRNYALGVAAGAVLILAFMLTRVGF